MTLVSDGSVARLSREARTQVDERRFRMLFLVAGCAEHEEDGWAGRLVRVGEAVVRVFGPVDRCATARRSTSASRRRSSSRAASGLATPSP